MKTLTDNSIIVKTITRTLSLIDDRTPRGREKNSVRTRPVINNLRLHEALNSARLLNDLRASFLIYMQINSPPRQAAAVLYNEVATTTFYRLRLRSNDDRVFREFDDDYLPIIKSHLLLFKMAIEEIENERR